MSGRCQGGFVGDSIGSDTVGMMRFSIGMRWWLTIAFALVSGLTALAVALVSAERSEQAFRSRTDVLALGNTVAATLRLREALALSEEGECTPGRGGRARRR